jgi:hypothetical protein
VAWLGTHRLEDKTIHLRFVSPRRAHHRLEDKTIHRVERVVLNALLPRLFAMCAEPFLVAQSQARAEVRDGSPSEIRLK